MENGLTGGLFWKMYGFVLAPYDDGVVEFFGLPNLVGGAQAIIFFQFWSKVEFFEVRFLYRRTSKIENILLNVRSFILVVFKFSADPPRLFDLIQKKTFCPHR
jgi:hypothetical protein